MPYKELTPDYLLGRIIAIGQAPRWRVLSIEPEDGGRLRACAEADETTRTMLDWATVREMIADGTITTE